MQVGEESVRVRINKNGRRERWPRKSKENEPSEYMHLVWMRKIERVCDVGERIRRVISTVCRGEQEGKPVEDGSIPSLARLRLAADLPLTPPSSSPPAFEMTLREFSVRGGVADCVIECAFSRGKSSKHVSMVNVLGCTSEARGLQDSSSEVLRTKRQTDPDVRKVSSFAGEARGKPRARFEIRTNTKRVGETQKLELLTRRWFSRTGERSVRALG